MRAILAISCAFFASNRTVAADLVYPAPKGFWLLPSEHSKELYGPTSSNADWHISQWDIPQDLPPFSHGITSNRWARVAWLGEGSYEFAQDGSQLPCSRVFRSGRNLTNEFDLNAAPNTSNTPAFPQAAGDHQVLLSRILRIGASITLHIPEVEIIDTTCPATKTAFMYSVVLSNMDRGQTLFYQVLLGFFTGDIGRSEATVTPGWFFTGMNRQTGAHKVWGFKDSITKYGQQWARIGKPQVYRFDLLTRLRSVLQDGASSGIDQDLDKWWLTGTYHGQALWGHVRNNAIWSHFSLNVSMRHDEGILH